MYLLSGPRVSSGLLDGSVAWASSVTTYAISPGA